ncbi:hypothetical protein FEM21_13240 [Flavobacterium seoulense]|uniref:Uncharacterized protein n=1 Tax=Flavobacterium seoulense TaxID=1492738 RepID=A0A066WNX6_9FLAO|nr:hypothetical protein FEM21_13240 [Flavobacterium seoulense]
MDEPLEIPLTVKTLLFVPEQTVASGPTEPFKGIPNVSGVLVHLLELSELPLTEANLVILIKPGLFTSQTLNPILPKGILNSRKEPPPLLQPVALPFCAASPLLTARGVLTLPFPEYKLKVDALEFISIIYSAPATVNEPPNVSEVSPVKGLLSVSKYNLNNAAPPLPIFIPNLKT